MSSDEETIRRYLLQELAEEERQRVEERMISDDDFLEEVSFVEDELVQEYIHRELKGVQRLKFEQFLITPEGQQELNFNRAFSKKIKAMSGAVPVSAQPRSFASRIVSFWRSQRMSAAPAFGVMIIFAALSMSLLVTERRRRFEIERLQTEIQRVERELADQRNQASQLQREVQESQERNSDLERQLAELKNSSDRLGKSEGLAAGILSLVLSPGRIRSSGSQTLTIPPDKHTVEFKLRVPSSDYSGYKAEVTGRSGVSISHQALEITRARSETRVILRVPAEKLVPGDYEIKLLGTTAQGRTEPIDSYYFVIDKK